MLADAFLPAGLYAVIRVRSHDCMAKLRTGTCARHKSVGRWADAFFLFGGRTRLTRGLCLYRLIHGITCLLVCMSVCMYVVFVLLIAVSCRCAPFPLSF